MNNEVVTLARPARTVVIRCGDHAWTYIKYMGKVSPGFHITMENIDIIHRDGKPVEIQISARRKWTESTSRGRVDSARLYIRTVEEEIRLGNEDAKVWKHDFDPMGSTTVGPNGKRHPILCDSIEVGEYEDVQPSREIDSNEPGDGINAKMEHWPVGSMPNFDFHLDAEFRQVRTIDEAKYILELTLNRRECDDKPMIYVELYHAKDHELCLMDVSIAINLVQQFVAKRINGVK